MVQETDTTTLRGLLREVLPEHETIFDLSKLDPNGEKHPGLTTQITLQRRRLQPEPVPAPVRSELPKRDHVFHSLGGFHDYCSKYGSENLVILADVDGREISAILDESAKEGFEVVIMTSVIDPRFKPWVDRVIDKISKVSAFADFLMANRRTVYQPDGRELSILFSQIRVAKNMTIQTGFGKKAVNGMVCEIEVMGQKKEELVELPDEICIECPIYVDTPPVKIPIDLVLLEQNGEVFIKATSSEAEIARIAAFEAMCNTLKGIKKGLVGLGRPNWSQWQYLPRPTIAEEIG